MALMTRRFYRRSMRMAQAYELGLNGKQAMWADKKYRGHRTLPNFEKIFDDMGDDDISFD